MNLRFWRLPRTLYFKLLVSFGLLFVVTILLVIGWFEISLRHIQKREDIRDTLSEVAIVREGVHLAMALDPDTPPTRNAPLLRYLDFLARNYGIHSWAQDPHGVVFGKSFEGPIPDLLLKNHVRVGDVDTYDNDSSLVPEFCSEFYLNFPVDFGRFGTGRLHAIFRQGPEIKSAFNTFILGLAVIDLCLVLLVIPVSMLISSPLKRLEDAVVRYAGGDLSARVRICRNDEIGRLARSFNIMADKLERLVQGSRELVANVSHELRSPLARIRISQQMATESLEHEQERGVARHLDAIRGEINGLDELIGRILELTRFDLMAPAAPQPFDLAAVTRTEAQRYAGAAADRGLTMALDCDRSVAALGDADLMQLVLGNLLDNAVKYAEGGTIRVAVHGADERAQLVVSNGATQFSEEQLRDMFQPFKRLAAEQAGAPHADGYGLGLALARKFVTAMQGGVDAHSENGELTLTVTLPAA